MVTQYLYIEWKMKESLDSRFLKDSCVSGKPLVTPCQTAWHIHHKLQKRPQHDSSTAWALLITEDLCELWLTQCRGSVYFTTVVILSLNFKKRDTWFYICFSNVKSNSLPWPQLSGNVEMALSHRIFEPQLSSRPTQFTLFNLSGDSLLV